MILLIDFILHTFKSEIWYHPTKVHTFWIWPCYIRYPMLIINKFPGEFLLLVLLLHLSLKTTYSFIHQIIFFQCCLLFHFYDEYKVVYKFPCVFFSGVAWNCWKFMLILLKRVYLILFPFNNLYNFSVLLGMWIFKPVFLRKQRRENR